MSLERIKAVAEQILNRVPALRGKSEEATKQALVLPMLDALGFDIWNPAEVALEYDADFAIKKLGQKEKVDVAILAANSPRIYIEVKSVDQGQLEGHQGQLARYFNSTQSVTLGILTNGIEWRFFTDTGDPNMIDAEPFHIARLDSADQGMDVLARFAKPVFSPESIRDYATELLYTTKIATFLRNEMDLRDRSPSDALMRWMLKSDGMYDGLVNGNVIERFRPIAKTAMTRVFREIVRRSISAMETEASHGSQQEPSAASSPSAEPVSITPPPAAPATAAPTLEVPPTDVPEPGETQRGAIVTTERELRFFSIAKDHFERSSLANSSIFDGSAGKLMPISIAYKDTTGYFGIYFNRPRYWIMRVVIEARNPYVCLNVDPTVAGPLVPAGFTVLEPNSLEGYRLAINAPEDLHALNALVFAAFQKTIADRLRKSEVEAAVQQAHSSDGAAPAQPLVH